MNYRAQPELRGEIWHNSCGGVSGISRPTQKGLCASGVRKLLQLGFAQRITQPCQLCLAQKAFTPRLPIFLDVPARVGAIRPEPVLFGP